MWGNENIEDDQDIAEAIARSLADEADEADEADDVLPPASLAAPEPAPILSWLAKSRAFEKKLSSSKKLSPIKKLLKCAGVEKALIDELFENADFFSDFSGPSTVSNFEETMKEDPRSLDEKIMFIMDRYPDDLKERIENCLQDPMLTYVNHFNTLIELFTLPESPLPAIEKKVITSTPSSVINMPSSSSSSANKQYADPSSIEELRARRLAFFQRQKPAPEAKKAEREPAIEAPKDALKRKRFEKEEITFIDEEPKAAKKPRRRRR